MLLTANLPVSAAAAAPSHERPTASASPVISLIRVPVITASARSVLPGAHSWEYVEVLTFHFSKIYKSLTHLTQIMGYNLIDTEDRNDSGINNKLKNEMLKLNI